MRRICIISLAVLICSFGSVAYSQTENTDKFQTLDRVIAIVGQNMIKESDLETSFLQQTSGKGIIENAFDVKCDLFESLLINKLMLHQAEIDSVIVTEEEVNREMDNRIKYMIRAYGSEAMLERQMKKSRSSVPTSTRIQRNVLHSVKELLKFSNRTETDG